jgi:hypothetical protein
MFLKYSLPVFVFAALAVGQPVVIPYDSMIESRVSVDGMIDLEEQEYPATYTDKATGLTCHWGFDDSLMYVGIETKGRGWMAIGFGSPKMHESNIIIGYYTDDSTEVTNQTGTNWTHINSPHSDSALREAEIDFDEETGITTMEFVYPLKFPAVKGLAIPGLEPNDTYDLILAQNTKSPSFNVKHTNRSVIKVTLAPNPHLKAEGGK